MWSALEVGVGWVGDTVHERSGSCDLERCIWRPLRDGVADA